VSYSKEGRTVYDVCRCFKLGKHVGLCKQSRLVSAEGGRGGQAITINASVCSQVL